MKKSKTSPVGNCRTKAVIARNPVKRERAIGACIELTLEIDRISGGSKDFIGDVSLRACGFGIRGHGANHQHGLFAFNETASTRTLSTTAVSSISTIIPAATSNLYDITALC